MKQIIQNLRNGDTLIENVPAPKVKRGHVLIKTTRTLISLGTEKMLVEFGQAGLISKARQQPEKVKMVVDKIKTDGLKPTLETVKNKLDQPLPLGYSNVGKVIEVGADVSDIKPGDRVVSNGCHAEIVCVAKNLVAKIPDEVSDEEATFTVVAAIGLQGMRLANPTFGETIVVTGLGLIGLIVCQLLKASGCSVIGFDFDPNKVEIASAMGVDAYCVAGGVDPVKIVMEHTNQVGSDAVIITASTPSNDVIHQSAEMSRKRGRIILVGVIGLNLSRADFYEKELTFQVSCSYGPGRYDDNYETKGNDYPLAFVRWTEKRNFEAVLKSMQSQLLQVAQLITLKKNLEDVVDVYKNISNNKHHLGILIKYPEEVNMNRTIEIFHDSPASGGKCKIAVVGAGNFSQGTILPCLKKCNADIKSIVSGKGVSGNHAAKKYGIQKSCSDYSEVLSDTDITALVITTPHNLHAQMVLDGLEKGKHIFVEKPLCLREEELEKIIKIKKDRPNQHLIVGFNRRFSPLVDEIKKHLKSSASPKNMVMTVNAGFIPTDHWTQDPDVGGGRILGEACHFIDLLSHVCGHSVSEVCTSALGKNIDLKTDNVSILLRFTDGSQGVVNYFANGSKSYAKERLEVFSDGSVFVLDNFRKLFGFGVKSFKSKKLSAQDKGHAQQFRLFNESIANGNYPIIPFASIVNSTKASFAVLKSLENSVWVKVT